MSLRTDYKDDIFEGSRLWRLNQNEDGTYTITDVTNYTQKGDKFGQNDVNAITGAINGLDAAVTGIITVALPAAGWTTDASGLYKQTVAVTDITSEDMPLLLKYTAPDTSKDDGTDYGIDFGMLSGGQCGAGSVTFYATDVLASDITVCLALGKKGDGRLLMGGGGSPEKSEISNVVITITDNAAIAEGGAVTATCNGKSWSSTIKNGKAKLYASEVGNYTITVVTTDAEPVTYTTMLVCPYFGQFSTDIYSGTLVVTCTEEGGNGKTCNVRSCDDEYNHTDAYNLTQTFDTTLELTFLGIPAGKYLVTVDDKYVFFKEIVTIQNINKVQVELKQWLYKNGDECPWNTGGLSYGRVEWVRGRRSGGSGAASCSKKADNIIFSGKAAANTYYGADDGYAGYYLNDCWSYTNIIVDKAYKNTEITKYTSAIINGEKVSSVGSQTPKFVIRTGSKNDNNTITETATVIYRASVTTGNVTLNIQNIIANNDVQFVFGMTLGSKGHEGWQDNVGSYSYEYTYKLYSIYFL